MMRRGAGPVNNTAVGAGMVLLGPAVQSRRVDEQAQDVRQPQLVSVEADETSEPPLRLEVRIGDTAFKQVIKEWTGAHQKLLTLARCKARPPDEYNRSSVR